MWGLVICMMCRGVGVCGGQKATSSATHTSGTSYLFETRSLVDNLACHFSCLLQFHPELVAAEENEALGPGK